MSERQTGATDAQIEAAAERHYRANTGVAMKPWDDLSPEARAWACQEFGEYATALVPVGWRIVRRIDGVAFDQLSAHICEAIVEAEAGLFGDTLTTPALTDVVIGAIAQCGYEVIVDAARVPTEDELAAMRWLDANPFSRSELTRAHRRVLSAYLDRQR